MPYKNLLLPSVSSRPFFYTSFATTLDGKVYINKKGYWPIGSRVDYEAFTNLRAYADAIIDGKNTAMRFAKHTIETIHSADFKKQRATLGKTITPLYIILTKHPDKKLTTVLENPWGYEPVIFKEDITALVDFLQKQNLQYIFVDGGPHVIASLLREKLLDEIFLTIAPRIFGNEESLGITMVEGILLEPSEIKLELVSMEQVENEVFLHYKVLYS